MKCAYELTLIKTEAEKQYAIQQEEERKRREEEYQEIVKNTIEYCETTINSQLETMARLRCKEIKYSIRGYTREDSFGNRIFSPLYKTFQQYADGTVSESPKYKEKYDIKVMQEHLKKHCINLIIKPISYCTYGYGEQKGEEITISI